MLKVDVVMPLMVAVVLQGTAVALAVGLIDTTGSLHTAVDWSLAAELIDRTVS